ncbi:MAG: Phenylpropionate dioxygenase ferredoxin reductase subunit [Tardiphaga sp.]|nr:Phenylpropionate dioxygenase ferredoxin reductase subunit [Tardiphaga sp.]
MEAAIVNIVIAGAGQAGGRASEALRAAGFAGAITMIGEETHYPYERPQLSKQFLSDRTSQVAYLRSADAWRGVLDIDVITGHAIVDCDARKRIVATRDGRHFPYDRLLIATGTQPRRIRAIEGTSARIQYLRSVEDALALRESLHSQSRVVVLGGGVIGLEAACAAAKQGCDVTVVEGEARLLARAFPKIISDFVEAKHRAHGVKFVFGETVVSGIDNGVRLSNGGELAADILLVGIGVEPSTAVAEQLGLTIRGGIEVDAFGRTADPAIYSAGDVALQWSHCHQRAMRIETWANAQNQAACVAGNMIGIAREYVDPPWFWTDQYDLNIQVVGDPTRGDHVVRGDVGSGRFSLIALRDGAVAGAVSINAAKDMAMLRRLAGKPAKLDRSNLESPSFDLRHVLKSN